MSIRQYTSFVLISLFFLIIFIVSIIPFWDFDIWFHFKSGEILAKLGIIHYDVFSYRTAGREWFPYEWLFQVIVYYFGKFFGFDSIKLLVAGCATAMIGIIYLILDKLFKLNYILSLSLCFLFFVSIYEFFGGRPHIFAYTFLLAELFLILTFYFQKRNLLWITIPITLAWANMHGSIFLSIAFFVGYALMSLVNYYLEKDQEWLTKFKTLSFYSVGTTILTILPPLGFLQYRLLFIFFQNRTLISNFIEEWTPLSDNPIGFIVYSSTAASIFLICLIIIFKLKLWKKALWLIPLLPLPATAYAASRNVFIGYISLVLILGWSLAQIRYEKLHKVINFILLLILSGLIAVNIWLLTIKRVPLRLWYPIQATQFIKNYHLKGNMFNEYGFGGYLLYQLYPDQKVFIDGRTDLYLCCELPELLDMSKKKSLPDDQYKKFIDEIFKKYQTSYILVRTQKHMVLRRVAELLTNDPNWDLVYWDDNAQIIVRRDGKNDKILKQFETKAATPYNRNPYRPGMETQAMAEYQKMLSVSDSAKTRNAIGFLLLHQQKYDEAKIEFEKAIKLDPEYESPYMNLGELAYKDGDLDTAISLYDKAQRLAPDRGLIYIRIGQLYLERYKDKIHTREIFEKGIKETVDEDAKKRLQDLISKL